MTDSAPDLGIDHLSYTSISMYLMCGQCFEKRYILKLPAPMSPALLFGRAFHETVERYVLQRAAGNGKQPLEEIWRERWLAALTADGDHVEWGDDTPAGLEADGVRILQSPASAPTLDSITPLRDGNGEWMIERFIRMSVDGVPVPIVGFVDLIANDGVPIDFKTARAAWSEKRAQSEQQPVFYIEALEQAGYTNNPHRRFRHYIFTKTKTPRVQILETQRTATDIKFLHEMIRRVWKGIVEGVFVPNPTTWKCSPDYCEYWEACRADFL